METFAAKIKAVIAARNDINPDFATIARTDLDNNGYNKVAMCSNAYPDTGADMDGDACPGSLT